MGGAQAAPDMTQFISFWWSWFNGTILFGYLDKYVGATFWIAVIGSLAGAAGGALGAQHIAERSKRREDLLKEIRNTNAAIGVCFALVNSLLGVKKQHVRPLKEGYDAERAALQAFQQAVQGGQLAPGTAFHFQANLMFLQVPNHPTEILQTIIFERLMLTGRPLSLVFQIAQSIDGFTDSVRKRNDLIRGFQANYGNGQGLECPYFGLPFPDGQVNMEYPHTVDAISNQCDDGIHFVLLLTTDLRFHGLKLSKAFGEKFPKEKVPRITDIGFNTAKNEGNIPDPEQYQDWEKAFQKEAIAPTTVDKSHVIHKN